MAQLPFGRCPVDYITGIWQFHRPANRDARAVSLPGHLIHYVIKGGYTLFANRREYAVKPGSILYYYESEEVLWKGGPQPVSFYSIGFMAQSLPPLPPDRRCIPAVKEIAACFAEMYKLSSVPESHERNCSLYGKLMEILAFLYKTQTLPESTQQLAGGWWETERRIREEKLFRAGMDDLIRMSGRSYSSLHRTTSALFKQAPLQRVRDIRLDEAKGLLRYSSLSITEIADYLGYPGISEFSREFSACYGKSPRIFRTTSDK